VEIAEVGLSGASFHDFSALLGATLETKAAPRPTAAVLAGKEVVGLYFSAHWCPPCRRFTPQLGTFYDGIKAQKSFEVNFVSSDRDAAQFSEYYAEQAGWAALPFKDRITKNALSKQFKVRGHSHAGPARRPHGRSDHDGRPRGRLVGAGRIPPGRSRLSTTYCVGM